MTTTMILEERSSGHLLVCVRILAQLAMGQGYRVVDAMPADVRSSAAFSVHLAPLEGSVEFVDCSTPLSPKIIKSWVASLILRAPRKRVFFWTIGCHAPDSGVKKHARLSFYRLAHGPGITGGSYKAGDHLDLADVIDEWITRLQPDAEATHAACLEKVAERWTPAAQLGRIERALRGMPTETTS